MAFIVTTLLLSHVGGHMTYLFSTISLLFFDSFHLGEKNHFSPYVLELWSIWSLNFGNSHFSPCYFQLAFNLDPTVNSLTENAYVTNGLHS